MSRGSARRRVASQGELDEASRILALAQMTADQAIADAQAEAARIIAAAREQAEQIIADARGSVGPF
jgi:vacuolar-type H+-ATPase subunit H